jgi:hypothetical protein
MTAKYFNDRVQKRKENNFGLHSQKRMGKEQTSM